MLHGADGDQRIVGICLANIEDESVKDTCMAIAREAIKRGYKVMLFTALTNLYYDNIFSHGEVSIFGLVDPGLIDVLFVLPESIKRDEIWQYIVKSSISSGIPTVCVNKQVEGCPSIVFNYRDTFEEIVRHIIEHHRCRRVNFIAGQKGNSFSEERVDCYKRVLAENGIDFDPTRLGYGDFWEVPARRVMEEFLRDPRGLPEAIICCNDTMAITACQVLREHGYSVPGDVIVSGFDGIELEKYVVPRLTTASFDFEALGRTAADLADMITEGREPPELTSIPFKMRCSESCGCLDVPDEVLSDKILELYRRINSDEGHEEHMFAYVYHTVEFTSFDQMGDIMPRFADLFTWCCLNTDFVSDRPAEEKWHQFFTPRMLMLAKCDRGKVERNVEFDTKDLLPDLEGVLKKHDILMFMPMHFQEEIMGYMAVSVNTEDFNFTNTHRFVNNTNQIFENLKNKLRLESAYSKLTDMHMRDPMTNIYNRRGFYAKAEEMWQRLGDSVRYVLFSCDLDGLKQINDTYGHSVGDTALMTASRAIDGGCGQEWISARFGGDEFIVLAAAADPEECIGEYLERVERELADFNLSCDEGYNVGVSIGAETLEGRPDQAGIDEAMKHADREMYKIKKLRHSRD